MKQRVCALSTMDNPFDYFDEFDNWFAYDTQKGYNSCALLARIAKTSNRLSSADYAAEVERAIDRILALNLPENFIKVVKDVEIDPVYHESAA